MNIWLVLGILGEFTLTIPRIFVIDFLGSEKIYGQGECVVFDMVRKAWVVSLCDLTSIQWRTASAMASQSRGEILLHQINNRYVASIHSYFSFGFLARAISSSIATYFSYPHSLPFFPSHPSQHDHPLLIQMRIQYLCSPRLMRARVHSILRVPIATMVLLRPLNVPLGFPK